MLALLTAWIWKGVDVIQLLTTPALLGFIVILGLVMGVPWVIESRRWKKSLDAVREEERQAIRVDPVLELTGHRRRWGFFWSEPMMVQLLPEGFEVERKDHILEGKWAEVTRWERSGLDRRMALYTKDVRELGDVEALRMWVRRMLRTLRQSLPCGRFRR